jgi:hypothetical protein
VPLLQKHDNANKGAAAAPLVRKALISCHNLLFKRYNNRQLFSIQTRRAGKSDFVRKWACVVATLAHHFA